jgi:hypothetical protein
VSTLAERVETVVDPGVGDDRTWARWLRRPILAGLLLLVAYLGLSLLCSPDGFLGTDTGGKVATLRVMADRGDLDPDVGYWAAAWDPDARVHGLYYTSVVGDRYLNVTTLPMVLAAAPLYDALGYRGALLLPMLGGVATAFAARALARRLADTDGWAAFWIVGLATPVAVYALDFWEHAPGLALMAWAVVAAVDAVRGPTRWWQGLGVGALFGAAASMRTEAFVYVLTTVALACLALVISDRRWRDAVVVGATSVVGFAVAFGANLALEVAVLGEPLRSGRASGAAGGGLSAFDARLREGLTTTLSPFPTLAAEGWIVGACLAAALVYVAARGSSPPGRPAPTGRLAPPVVVAAVVVVLVVLWRLVDGLGFVPGLVAATPFAAAGLALGWGRVDQRLVLLMALVPMPLVFAFQFRGGAAPQWAGRYLLLSGFLLAVVGIAASDRMARPVRLGFVGLSVLITAFGIGWLAVRSHDVADAAARLEARPEAVLISPNGFVPREFGATYPDRNWLAAGNGDDLRFAFEVADRAGAPDVALVDVDTDAAPRTFPGWTEVGSELEPFIAGSQVRVTTYVRDDG